jgi:hypothetical protein
MHTIECKNCNKHYQGKFCPVCAQPASTGRIDSHYFLHDIPHSVFHVDKGFPYTFASLFTRPAGMLKEYLAGRRVKYFRPFAYVVLMSAICTFLIAQLDKVTDSLYLSYHPGAKITEAHGFFQHYFSVFIFLLIPATALVTWLFFRKRQLLGTFSCKHLSRRSAQCFAAAHKDQRLGKAARHSRFSRNKYLHLYDALYAAVWLYIRRIIGTRYPWF